MENKNTVLFIEPRIHERTTKILNYYVSVIGKNWNYVFYCGKNTKKYWEKSDLNKIYELRELDVVNFNTEDLYSDFMKQKKLWESLYGEFVLTMQIDTWITNDYGYTIDDFIKLNKSFIGGNMSYHYIETYIREDICFEYDNFNGGLSLRKRKDMIKIINSFPPQKTSSNPDLINRNIFTDAEDVYFLLGCYKLGLPLGDDEDSSHFTVHTVFKEKFWGIHKPHKTIEDDLIKHYPKVYYLNPYIDPNYGEAIICNVVGGSLKF